MNTQLFLAGMEVDLTDVISIPLNKTFEDLSNPSDINNDFSKEIRLQVNIKNNEVLGNAFRIDRNIIVSEGEKNIGKYLNPTRKIPFKLFNNGDVIMDGYAKLSLADYSYDSKYYTINLFGTLGDLFHKLLNVTPNIKFCPELDARTEVYDEANDQFYLYAVPFDKVTDELIVREIAPSARESFRWRDIRYLIENKDIKSPMDNTDTYINKNYISGEKSVDARSIKECWETDPDDTIKGSDLDTIKKSDTGDWQIIGFMPSHHGFPDNFDAKAVEEHLDGVIQSNLFADIAKEKSLYSVDTYIGDGITEEQFLQFISWQQKPYIYISKLFKLFQKHMERNSDLFNGYMLELDEAWENKVQTADRINNPYWANLIYTFDFLFNQKSEGKIFSVNATFDGDVTYTHVNGRMQDGDDTYYDNITMSGDLKIMSSSDDVLKSITLNGYVCCLLPIKFVKSSASTPPTTDLPYTYVSQANDNPLFAGAGQGKYFYRNDMTPPAWFFSTGYQQAKSDSRSAINGNYSVDLRVIDEENDTFIFSTRNVWYNDKNGINRETKKNTDRPLIVYKNAYKTIGMFDPSIPQDDRMVVNRRLIIPEYKNGHYVAPSDFTYRNNMSWTSTDGYPICYVEVMFPLRSFGAIPVGVKKPKIEVALNIIGHNYYSKDSFEYYVGNVKYADIMGLGEMKSSLLKTLNNPYFRNSSADIHLNDDHLNIYTDMCIRDYNTYEIAGYYFENTTRGDSTGYWKDILGTSRYLTANYANAINGINFTLGDDRQDDVSDKFEVETYFYSDEILCTCETSTSPNLKKCTLANLWEKEDSLFDILIQYSKMIGLYWDVDYNSKKIKLQTRYAMFKDYTIEDWTDKVDYSKEYKVTPILHASKYLNFNYDDIEDGHHYSDYKASYLTNYGGYRLKTGYEFTPDSEDIFKGLQPSCFSNRPILTWRQIYEYNPISGIRSHISPLTLLDSDSADGTSPLALNTWCFRMPSKGSIANMLTNEDLENWNVFADDGLPAIRIANATPTMIGSDKYSYVGHQDYYYLVHCIETLTSMPNFCNATGEYGSLFAKPLEDYTIADVDNGVRQGSTDIQKTSVWLFNKFWEKWMNERYNINNKKLTCYIKFSPEMFKNIAPNGTIRENTYFSNFKVIDNLLYILNKIYDYNVAQDSTAKCEFILITDVDAYKDNSVVTFGDGFYLTHKDDTLTATNGSTIVVSSNVRQYIPEKDASKIENKFSPSRDYYYSLPYKLNTTYNTMDYFGWTNRIPLNLENRPMFSVESTANTSATIQCSQNAMLKSTSTLTDYISGLATNNTKVVLLLAMKPHSEAIYFDPYFTFFYEDNTQFKSSWVTATNDAGVKRSITFNVPNIATEFMFNHANIDKGIYTVDFNGDIIIKGLAYHTYAFDIFNNWGSDSFYMQDVSFYEIPIHIIQRAEKYEGSDVKVELDAYANIILPTKNRCVEPSKYDRTSDTIFAHEGTMTMTGNPMIDNAYVFSDIIEKIRTDVHQQWPAAEVEIAKNNDGKSMPIRLYTTWLYALKYNTAQSNTVDSKGYIYNKAYRKGIEHYNYTIYNTIGIDDSTLQTVKNNENIGKQDLTLVNYCYDNIYRFAHKQLETNISFNKVFEGTLPWKRNHSADIEQAPYVFFGCQEFWYPGDKYLPESYIDLFGRMCVYDLDKYVESISGGKGHTFLVDPDDTHTEYGNDGYIYHTFCQELLPPEQPQKALATIYDEKGRDITIFDCHIIDNMNTATVNPQIKDVDIEWLYANSNIIVKVMDAFGNEKDDITINATIQGNSIILDGLQNITGQTLYILIIIEVNNSLTKYVLFSPCGSDMFTFIIDSNFIDEL